MKIILSRKGFDAGTGKVASPIFPDGAFCSLPIPEPRAAKHSHRYKDITFKDLSLGTLVTNLTKGKITPDHYVHLDPDLSKGSIPREANWKPIFGQVGPAEAHLQGKDVGKGDIFLFYGWFREVEQIAGKYSYVTSAPDQHVIFGWLQIEQRVNIAKDKSTVPRWALYHPHCVRSPYGNLDSLYISVDKLNLPGLTIDRPGAGVFKKFSQPLCLTAPGEFRRSFWQLPGWFYPRDKKPALSYHRTLGRWKLENGYAQLRSVGRGQEFVLDSDEYPESLDWLNSLLKLSD